MIAHIRGSLLRIAASSIVVDVQGVGYKVVVPVSVLTALPKAGEPVALHIHTAVREDDITLYGFLRPEDQAVFELLIAVSGVGPKIALAVLSAMDAETLAQSIAAEDAKSLVRVPGLGLKTAQRLILELREKLAAFAFQQRVEKHAQTPASAEPDVFGDVVEGLVNLGYNRNDARKAADRALREVKDPSSMAEALRAALNLLTGSGA